MEKVKVLILFIHVILIHFICLLVYFLFCSTQSQFLLQCPYRYGKAGLVSSKVGRTMAHRALSQGRDDVSQSRQRLVDVFGLIQDGSCSSSLTDLEERKKIKRVKSNMRDKHVKKSTGTIIMKLIMNNLSPRVFSTFSLPARSTRYSFPHSFCSVSTCSCLMLIRKMLWLRELCSFMSAQREKQQQLRGQKTKNDGDFNLASYINHLKMTY